MTEKEQIKFWEKAIKIIKKTYGKRCRDFAWGCSTCQAYLVIAWMEDKIALIEWRMK